MKLPSTIAAANAAIAAGSLKPSQLLTECLSRIERWEDKVHAWALVDRERALAEAQRLDGLGPQQLAALPLAGIPIGIKDIFDIAGLPTRGGSTLTGEQPATKDATAVARLRAAGAILLGKTVTTEFAYIDPPPTRNPWNLEHTPGGSSSGSAAAAALGMCLGALGSQTGGSIIRPAAYCGVVGFKPSFGRIDRSGVFVQSPLLDHLGAITTSVADMEILWRVLADPRPAARPPAEHGHAEHHHALFHHHPPHKAEHFPDAGFPRIGPRLAVAERFLADTSPEVLLVIEVTLNWLESHGAELCVVKLPVELEEIRAMHRTIMAREIADYHRQQYAGSRNRYGRLLAGLIEEGLAIDDARYHAAREHQLAFKAHLATAFGTTNAWLTPASTSVAPGLDSTGDGRFNSPWSYGGVPAISLPAGLAVNGLPVGLQLVGRPDGDDQLLAVAKWCEACIAFDGRPPMAEAK